VAGVLGPSVRPTAPPFVKTGHTRPAFASANIFGEATVSDEQAFPIPVVACVRHLLACRHGRTGMLKARAYWPHMPGTGRKEIVGRKWLIGKGTIIFCT